MKPPKLCFSILVALLASFSILPAQAGVVTLFEDHFDYASAGTVKSPSSTKFASPPAGYSATTNSYPAGGSVKFGTADYGGMLTTTNFNVQAGTLTVKVDAVGYDSSDKKFIIAVGSNSYEFTCTQLRSTYTEFDHFSQDFVVGAGVTNVTFSTADGQRAILDNVLITQNILSSEDEPVFSVNMQSGPTVDELTAVAFTISALVGASPTNVSYISGVPSGANYSFSSGAFSWTPALGEAGTYPLIFSAVGGDSQTYSNTVTITVTALALTAPANLAVNNVTSRTFDASWNPVTAATQGYVVDVWYGSSSPNTPNSDLETFFESINKVPVQPLGWTFSGITAGYNDKNIGGITLNEVGFDTQDDTIITRLYPKGVTNLAFRIQGRSTSNSVLRVSGSADGTVWTEVGVYSSEPDSDGDDENNIFTAAGGDLDKNLAFSESLNYRKFKFVYTKDKGNVGIVNIAAMYEGAGTKFIPGWQAKATVSTLQSISGAKPGCPHYLRVGAKNAIDTKYSMIRFQTLELPASTLITLR